MKPIKLMLKDEKYIKMFSRLGENTNISTEILDSLIEFVTGMDGKCMIQLMRFVIACIVKSHLGVNTYPHVPRF